MDDIRKPFDKTDIASKLWYSGASYFIEIFKKITRRTPVEFRKGLGIRQN